ALYELARYDALHAVRGFDAIRARLARKRTCIRRRPLDPAIVCNAVELAACFYVKPVLCLQRSVCAARLLRRHGTDARLVIACRPVPFFSHAWVEVDGRVVNDSPVYRERLNVLYTA